MPPRLTSPETTLETGSLNDQLSRLLEELRECIACLIILQDQLYGLRQYCIRTKSWGLDVTNHRLRLREYDFECEFARLKIIDRKLFQFIGIDVPTPDDLNQEAVREAIFGEWQPYDREDNTYPLERKPEWCTSTNCNFGLLARLD
jgi:hypothetical protein